MTKSIHVINKNSREYQAARFLTYASLGADYKTIKAVARQGIPNWLEDQLKLPPTSGFKDTTSKRGPVHGPTCEGGMGSRDSVQRQSQSTGKDDER